MDYEKKYNEALNWMRELYPGLHGATKEDAEHYFPELRESEDERIRKGLVGLVSTVGEYYLKLDSRNKMLAWLEKQKEQKGLDVTDYCQPIHPDIAKVLPDVINNLTWKEDEQKEQKPAEWDELQSEFKNINEAFEDGKKEVVGNPEKYGLQKPAEWSEEDEVYLQDALWCIKQAEKSCKDGNDKGACWSAERWLKSLRPSWKPSKEYMDALLNIEGDLRAFQYNDKAKIIAELYEQLKRL